MRQYLDFLQHILDKGKEKNDRTNTGTISTFGYQMRFDLQEGFPLLTTKKVHMKSVIHELLWFISGSTNIKYLVDHDVRIWNEWPFEKYKTSPDYQGEDLQAFVQKTKDDALFAQKHGDLGPVYGYQWRNFKGDNGFVDQIAKVIEEIQSNPNSRRLIVNAWHPAYIKEMALPPCHMMFQFYVQEGRLSCQLYQRSADAFLGVPFNIASYALFTMMIAHVCDLQLGEFIHTMGDAHIYINHMEQIQTQLSREPRPLPKLIIVTKRHSIDDFVYDDFVIEGYDPHPAIKGKVAV